MLSSLPVLSTYPILNFVLYVILYLGIGAWFSAKMLIEGEPAYRLPSKTLVFFSTVFWPLVVLSLACYSLIAVIGWLVEQAKKLFS